MQSSPLMAFRATVLIVCLVGVPLAAVFGTSLPQMLRPSGVLLADRNVAHLAHNRPRNAEHNPAAGKAATPPLTSQTATNASQPAQPDRSDVAATAEPRPPAAAQPAQGGPAASITAVRPLLAQPSGQFWAAGAGAEPPQREGPDTTLRATAYSRPARAPQSAGRQPRVPPDIVGGQERLRELGAVEYRLETWGEQGDLFRFHCRMPTGDGSPAQRHFEATDRDPSTAVISVVREVERWRQMR